MAPLPSYSVGRAPPCKQGVNGSSPSEGFQKASNGLFLCVELVQRSGAHLQNLPPRLRRTRSLRLEQAIWLRGAPPWTGGRRQFESVSAPQARATSKSTPLRKRRSRQRHRSPRTAADSSAAASAEDSAMREQPSGSVTLVFTDIEGSTRLLREFGEEGYRDALGGDARSWRGIRGRLRGRRGGDAFFYAFPSAGSAVAAVEQVMRTLERWPIRIRWGSTRGSRSSTRPNTSGSTCTAPPGDGRWTRRPGAAERVGAGAARRRGASARPREHRLKEMSGPQRLYQLGADAFSAQSGARRTCGCTDAARRPRARGRGLAQLLRREDVSVARSPAQAAAARHVW